MAHNPFEKLYASEKSYWWSVGRRKLINRHIKRLFIPKNDPMILDFGCGGGALLTELTEYGNVIGLEHSYLALSYCRNRGQENLVLNDGEEFPFKNNSFEIVVCLDVLEHLKNDFQFLRQIYEILSSDGYILIMVPAFPSLWSSRDAYLGHYRRYTRLQLNRNLENLNFNIVKMSYINFFYLPIMLFLLLMEKIFDHSLLPSNTLTTPDMLNKLLTAIVVLENNITTKISFPLGVSLFCIAQKKRSNT
jgi:2-polyprenyl-3-methyl-5-hydroxy-6-metoxy-1,4-benzoquinol methylase